MAISNKERIEQLSRELTALELIVWEFLALDTGAASEGRSFGAIRLRKQLAKKLGKPDPAA